MSSNIHLIIVIFLGIVSALCLMGVVGLPLLGASLSTEEITFLSTVMSTALGALIGVLKVDSKSEVKE